MKYWEIIADNLHNAGWSLGWLSALDLEGRTIWIVDAHDYGKGDTRLRGQFDLINFQKFGKIRLTLSL
jgi:hypothetical protein